MSRRARTWRRGWSRRRASCGRSPAWGTFNAWPAYFHEFADKVGQQPEMRRPLPSPRAVTEAEEAMVLASLARGGRRPPCGARVSGSDWKAITWRFGISRATATRRWVYALSVIVWRLNGKRVPKKRSMQFVIDGARAE